MGNSPFALRSVVWPSRLNSGVKHHGKRFDSGVRTANEKVQLGGHRVRDRGVNDIVQFMAVFSIKPGSESVGGSHVAIETALTCRRETRGGRSAAGR